MGLYKYSHFRGHREEDRGRERTINFQLIALRKLVRKSSAFFLNNIFDTASNCLIIKRTYD